MGVLDCFDGRAEGMLRTVAEMREDHHAEMSRVGVQHDDDAQLRWARNGREFRRRRKYFVTGNLPFRGNSFLVLFTYAASFICQI